MQDLTFRNSEIEQIAKRVDVVCKAPKEISKCQQVLFTFQEFSHYCLSRTSSGPVVCVKRCKLSNHFSGRDVVESSRGMSTGYFGQLMAVITTGIVSKQVPLSPVYG
jgi:hypothetical protein